MNLLKYFILVNDITTVFPDLDISLLSTYEVSMITLFINLCVWLFIYIILSVIFKIVVRLS